MVEIESESYKSTLLDKEADVVMEMSASWHASLKDTDPVTAVASPYTSEPDLMIGINSNLIERAPNVVNLLEAFKLGENEVPSLETIKSKTGSFGNLGCPPTWPTESQLLLTRETIACASSGSILFAGLSRSECVKTNTSNLRRKEVTGLASYNNLV